MLNEKLNINNAFAAQELLHACKVFNSEPTEHLLLCERMLVCW